VKAVVYVTLKPGVLDPQGQAVSGTLSRLGYGEVASVRVGKTIELELNEAGLTEESARERISEMCERLLANTVIEDYRIELGAGERG